MAMPLKSLHVKRFSASVLELWDGYYVTMIKAVRDTTTKNYPLKQFSQKYQDRRVAILQMFTCKTHNIRCFALMQVEKNFTDKLSINSMGN